MDAFSSVHVHIRDENKQVWQTIYGVKICDKFVVTRALRSVRDRPNPKQANQVAYGRIEKYMAGNDESTQVISKLSSFIDWLQSLQRGRDGKYWSSDSLFITRKNKLLNIVAIQLPDDCIDMMNEIEKIVHTYKYKCEHP